MGRTFPSDPFYLCGILLVWGGHSCPPMREVGDTILGTMKAWSLVLTLIALGSAFAGKPPASIPTKFEVGRHTFFDFGPPFDYYEIIVVRPVSNGSSVERVLLTPSAGCFQPAKIEVGSGSLSQTVSELLGSNNPCSIPDKELRRELKCCKHCSSAERMCRCM